MKFYLRLYPENAKYFAENLRSVTEQAEERSFLEDEQERGGELPESEPLPGEPEHIREFPKEMVYDRPSFEELDAFDRSENPIRDRELRRYLRELNVKGVLSDYTSQAINPKAPTEKPKTTFEDFYNPHQLLSGKDGQDTLPTGEDELEDPEEQWAEIQSERELDFEFGAEMERDLNVPGDDKKSIEELMEEADADFKRFEPDYDALE
jgi:hypothetical protein